MKKEIEKLLKSEDAYLKLNKFCTLHRWTKNAFGEQVDCLRAEFSILHEFDHLKELTARDWRGIVEQVCELQQKVLKVVGETLSKELKNGYIY